MSKLTKTAWGEFSPKAQWDCVVALRGPDSNYGETVKWFTTSVIRGKMQGVMRVGGLVNSHLNLVVLPATHWSEEEAGPSKKSAWNYHHFCTHVRTAADWLDIPILLAESDVWHKLMRLNSASQAVQALLKVGEQWHKDAEKEEKKETPSSSEEVGEDVPLTFKKFVYSKKHSGLYAKTGLEELKRHLDAHEITF